MFFALDIGTTTVDLALITEKGSEKLTFPNPQRIFGADVISRIGFCKENGIDALHSFLIRKINESVNCLLNDCNIDTADIMFVSGNTTMLHTFFGIDCSSIGTSPYTPQFLSSKQITGGKIGIGRVKLITSLPCISAFVGADIVAGINHVGFPGKGRFNMLVDLGTNAECVIFSEDMILCTSAAAGPCFEGANITCGTPALKGAICQFEYNNSIATIRNAPPAGICATGLIDIIAELLKNNIIDETGRLANGKFCVTDDIYITQDDVRNFQTAKSAVYSAIKMLINKAGCSFRDIDSIFIAGGFSDKLNFSNAVITGLLPMECREKYKAVNNSSLDGTIDYALKRNDLSALIKNAVYYDLAQENGFAEMFIENMNFSFYE